MSSFQRVSNELMGVEFVISVLCAIYMYYVLYIHIEKSNVLSALWMGDCWDFSL